MPLTHTELIHPSTSLVSSPDGCPGILHMNRKLLKLGSWFSWHRLSMERVVVVHMEPLRDLITFRQGPYPSLILFMVLKERERLMIKAGKFSWSLVFLVRAELGINNNKS